MIENYTAKDMVRMARLARKNPKINIFALVQLYKDTYPHVEISKEQIQEIMISIEESNPDLFKKR